MHFILPWKSVVSNNLSLALGIGVPAVANISLPGRGQSKAVMMKRADLVELIGRSSDSNLSAFD
jgi:hypothetical protein